MIGRGIKAAVSCVFLSAIVGVPAAWAGGGNGHGNGLPWDSPNRITSGVPVDVASIAPCPAPPTAGDSVLVQVFLSFGPSGGSGQIVQANPDGSWAGQVTYTFSGVSRHTDISASCLDFNGVSATPYAQYMTRHTQVFS